MAIRLSTLALIAATVMALVWSCNYWISDAHQVSMFQARKSEYETLLKMLRDDRGLKFVNSGLSDPEDPGTIGISPRRIAEYREFMSKISCGAIRYEPSLGSALFVSDSWGATDILYFPMPSATVAGKFGLPFPPAQAHHIEGYWYLSSEKFR